MQCAVEMDGISFSLIPQHCSDSHTDQRMNHGIVKCWRSIRWNGRLFLMNTLREEIEHTDLRWMPQRYAHVCVFYSSVKMQLLHKMVIWLSWVWLGHSGWGNSSWWNISREQARFFCSYLYPSSNRVHSTTHIKRVPVFSSSNRHLLHCIVTKGTVTLCIWFRIHPGGDGSTAPISLDQPHEGVGPEIALHPDSSEVAHGTEVTDCLWGCNLPLPCQVIQGSVACVFLNLKHKHNEQVTWSHEKLESEWKRAKENTWYLGARKARKVLMNWNNLIQTPRGVKSAFILVLLYSCLWFLQTRDALKTFLIIKRNILFPSSASLQGGGRK